MILKVCSSRFSPEFDHWIVITVLNQPVYRNELLLYTKPIKLQLLIHCFSSNATWTHWDVSSFASLHKLHRQSQHLLTSIFACAEPTLTAGSTPLSLLIFRKSVKKNTLLEYMHYMTRFTAWKYRHWIHSQLWNATHQLRFCRRREETVFRRTYAQCFTSVVSSFCLQTSFFFTPTCWLSALC